MDKIVLTFTVLLLLCASDVTGSYSSAYRARARLKYLLLDDYDPDVIPSTPLAVRSVLNLVNFLNVDTEANMVELVIWQEMRWKDRSLEWIPVMEDNITSIRIPVDKIWTPDLHIYNSVSPVQTLTPSIAMVHHDGSVLIVQSERIQFSCDLRDVLELRGAECHIKIGSWTYDGNQVTLNENPIFTTEMQVNHTEYEILETSARKNTVFYDCCPDPYEDVTFSFSIRRI